jgi:hypothetical protein
VLSHQTMRHSQLEAAQMLLGLKAVGVKTVQKGEHTRPHGMPRLYTRLLADKSRIDTQMLCLLYGDGQTQIQR